PAYIDVGNLYYRKHDMDKAREFYLKAAERMPFAAGAWINLGSVYLDKMELQLAARLHEHALKMNPRDAAATFNLSQVYYKRGDYALADYYLRKAERLGFAPDPDYVKLIGQGLNTQAEKSD
ncbi:MAG: tetratricopeptide repeat protein, partial [bacterium]